MYVVATPQGLKKPALFKVRRTGTGLIGVIPDHTMYENDGEGRYEIAADDVMVNLGDNPPYGQVYGVLVEPVVERQLVRGWGEVFFYNTLTESVKQRVLRAFPEAMKRVKQLGPACDWEIISEIRNPRGLQLGCYRFRPNGADVLTLRPQPGGQDARAFLKLIVHELGHGVWDRHMDATQRSRWIRYYDRFVQVSVVSPKAIGRMIRDMRQIDGIRPYIKDSEPEEQAAATMFLGWLSKVHSIGVREANDLIVSGSDLPIPDTHIHRSEVNTPVTLYSKTSAPEMFCESLSSLSVGDLSDKNLRKLISELK